MNEFDQHESNCELWFALQSMRFEKWTMLSVRVMRNDGVGTAPLGGGSVDEMIRRYGSRKVIRSSIMSNGVLQVIVE